MYSSSFDIIGITETWLSSTVFDNEILPTDFHIQRRDRAGRGGGIMLAVRSSINIVSVFHHDDIELLTVVLSLPRLITVCLTYIPPNGSKEYHLTLHSYLHQLLSHSTNEILILGDMNYSDINWSSLSGRSEMSDLFDHGLFQYVTSATHVRGGGIPCFLSLPALCRIF